MKRALLLASIIGLFMATTMDLQARSRRNTLPQQGRSGIFFGLSLRAPLLDRYNSHGRYNNHPGRHVAREIRKNEKRIWKLEKRMEKLYRHGGNYREIRELEQEIYYLRNDLLRHRLY
jgi:predicted RNase H-like nuclease (RuvC/YqgF family)